MKRYLVIVLFVLLGAALLSCFATMSKAQDGYVLILKLSDGHSREVSDPLLAPGDDGGPFTTPMGCAIAGIQKDESWVADNGDPLIIIERICVPSDSADDEMKK